MPFEWFVALRYLRDAKGQTALILAAVAVGVSVIVFLSALINGLQTSLIAKTLGAQPHVTLREPREVARPLVQPNSRLAIARSIQPAPQRLRSIDQWPAVLRRVEQHPDVVAASPLVQGAGFAVRSDAKSPIVVRGIDAERFVGIIDVPEKITAGRFDVSGGSVVIGQVLAEDLGVGVGDKVRLTSSEGVDDVVTISGVFSLGNENVDRTWLITSLRHAQALFTLPGGVTAIDLAINEVFDAASIASALRDGTGLEADSWMKLNKELLEGLTAQSNSKNMIQFFVIIAVALGIASVLIVSVVQKAREIGILRAVGTPARRVLLIFLIQGGVLGLMGSFIGSGLGVLFAKVFETMTTNSDGSPRFPVTVDAPLLAFATLLATGIGLLAAVIPARRAARLDPATAIRNG